MPPERLRDHHHGCHRRRTRLMLEPIWPMGKFCQRIFAARSKDVAAMVLEHVARADLTAEEQDALSICLGRIGELGREHLDLTLRLLAAAPSQRCISNCLMALGQHAVGRRRRGESDGLGPGIRAQIGNALNVYAAKPPPREFGAALAHAIRGILWLHVECHDRFVQLVLTSVRRKNLAPEDLWTVMGLTGSWSVDANEAAKSNLTMLYNELVDAAVNHLHRGDIQRVKAGQLGTFLAGVDAAQRHLPAARRIPTADRTGRQFAQSIQEEVALRARQQRFQPNPTFISKVLRGAVLLGQQAPNDQDIRDWAHWIRRTRWHGHTDALCRILSMFSAERLSLPHEAIDDLFHVVRHDAPQHDGVVLAIANLATRALLDPKDSDLQWLCGWAQQRIDAYCETPNFRIFSLVSSLAGLGRLDEFRPRLTAFISNPGPWLEAIRRDRPQYAVEAAATWSVAARVPANEQPSVARFLLEMPGRGAAGTPSAQEQRMCQTLEGALWAVELKQTRLERNVSVVGYEVDVVATFPDGRVVPVYFHGSCHRNRIRRFPIAVAMVNLRAESALVIHHRDGVPSADDWPRRDRQTLQDTIKGIAQGRPGVFELIAPSGAEDPRPKRRRLADEPTHGADRP